MEYVLGVPTEFRRSVGELVPIQVIGAPTATAADPPLCPSCQQRTQKQGAGGYLCQKTADRVCGPPSRSPADNAVMLIIGGDPVSLAGHTVRAEPGTAMVIYVKGLG